MSEVALKQFRVVERSPATVAGVSTLADGTPVKSFVRCIARIGATYYKATRASRGKLEPYMTVTRKRADHWLSQNEKLKNIGLPIKATKDHKPRNQTDSVLGDVVDIFENDGLLLAKLEIRGADNIKLAEANKDVSLETDELLKAPDGNEYEDCIVAVSFVPDPVVINQPRDFSLAASQSSDVEDGVSEELAKAIMASQTKEPEMNEKLKNICSLYCGMGEEESEDKMLDALEALIKQLKEHQVKEEKGLKASLSADSAEVKLAHKYGKKALNGLDTKRFTPATISKLTDLLLGEAAPTGLLCSMVSYGNETAIDNLEKIVEILNQNEPVATVETTTAPKGLVMSRSTPDADPAKTSDKPGERISPLTGNKY